MKKTRKKPEDKSKSDHEPDEEAQKQRAVVRQEPGVLESESHDMIDAALYVQTNRSIGEIEQRLNHITQLHIQLQERLNHMDESQRMMHEKNQLFDRKANCPI